MTNEIKKTIAIVVLAILLCISVVLHFTGTGSYREVKAELDTSQQLVREQADTIESLRETEERITNSLQQFRTGYLEIKNSEKQLREIIQSTEERNQQYKLRIEELEKIYRNLGKSEQESGEIITESLRLIEQYENNNP